MQNIKTESGIDTTLSFFILLRAVSKINDRIPLLSVATPACFAGNSKPDPPPSPRLGGGCVLGKAEAKKADTTLFAVEQ